MPLRPQSKVRMPELGPSRGSNHFYELRAAFKDNHAASAHRQVVSVRQSYYAGADNRVIEFRLRHIDVCCA